jgi:putative ABC transport system permease protein
VVEGYVAVPALGGATMQLLGVDPFAEAPFRSFFAAASGDRRGADTALAALIVEPATVLLGDVEAMELMLHRRLFSPSQMAEPSVFHRIGS